jgi:hypothetical protein
MTTHPMRCFARVSGRAWLVVLVAALALGLARPVAAGKEINKSFFGGIAIEGTDPVAYFTEGRPVKGSSQHEHRWMDAKWRFASAANRDAFAAEPERFAPRYGGYCAWAVSRGYTATIDPEAWTVHGGRLYLNYSQGVRAQWAEDIPGNIAKGDANWPGLRAKLAN